MEHLYIYSPEWLSDELLQLKKELQLTEELIAGIKRLNEVIQFRSGDEMLQQAELLKDSITRMYEAIRIFTNESELVDRFLNEEYKALLIKANSIFE